MELSNSVAEPGTTAGEEGSFEPARLLAEIAEAGSADGPHPDRLPVEAIAVKPELFQPRGVSEKHISDLVKAIKAVGDLEAVIVLPAKPKPILIDGHHRIEAYKQAGRTEAIPVVYFEGTPQDAVLEAGQANSKAKLPMVNAERQDYAWRLVLLGHYSKAQIARAAGIAPSQVANMRKVWKLLGREAFDLDSWFRARRKAQGQTDDLNEAEREEWMQQQAARYADAMAKAFSTRLADRPQIAAMALAHYFGRRLPLVYTELAQYVPDDDEDTDDF